MYRTTKSYCLGFNRRRYFIKVALSLFEVVSLLIFIIVILNHEGGATSFSAATNRPGAFLLVTNPSKSMNLRSLTRCRKPSHHRFQNLRKRRIDLYVFPSSSNDGSNGVETDDFAGTTDQDSDLSILSAPTDTSSPLSGTQFVNDQRAALRHSDSQVQVDKNRKGALSKIGSSEVSDSEPTRTSSSSMLNSIQWDVYVCESKQSKERGSGATMGAFLGLAPSHLVSVKPAVISKPRGKGPNVRCIQRRVYSNSRTGKLITNPSPKAFEVNNVDSIDKVYRILTTHMNLSDNVDVKALKCLKYNYQGNAFLDKGEITQAIKAYDKALATGYKDQEGVLLVMRATAYLQRAFRHRRALKAAVQSLKESVEWTTDESKDSETNKIFTPEWKINMLLRTAKNNPTLAPMLLNRLVKQSNLQSQKFQQTKFRHGLYEYALLHATQDSLRSTQLLPRYAKTWLRAGDSLAELRKLKEATYYYEKALELDPTLGSTLVPTIARLRDAQMAIDAAATSAAHEKNKFLHQ